MVDAAEHSAQRLRGRTQNGDFEVLMWALNEDNFPFRDLIWPVWMIQQLEAIESSQPDEARSGWYGSVHRSPGKGGRRNPDRCPHIFPCRDRGHVPVWRQKCRGTILEGLWVVGRELVVVLPGQAYFHRRWPELRPTDQDFPMDG